MTTRERLRLQAGIAAATLQRRRLTGCTFIGVTGSAGKTTTKELIAHALGSTLRGRKTPAQGNGPAVVAKTILRTTSHDQFCVLEVAAGPIPGLIAQTARMARPQIAVVTQVGSDHRSTYRTLEAVTHEKRALLSTSCDTCVAVLNADDPHVVAMAEGFAGRVVTFGRSESAELRAEDVRAAWPDRLSFVLCVGDQRVPVVTSLVGKHWVSSVLAALGVAHALGLSLETAAGAIARVPPTPGRMSPVTVGGVSVMLDDVKAPLWGMPAVFEFLHEACARRKIAVIGTISDYPGDAAKTYRRVAERALATADEVLFVGPNAGRARRAKQGPDGGSLHLYEALPEAAEHLARTVGEGDLVVLKGSRRADGLHRLISEGYLS